MQDFDDDCVIRDADIETAGLVAMGNKIADLRRKGVCLHGLVGPVKGVFTCKDCGETWKNEFDMLDEIEDLREKYC